MEISIFRCDTRLEDNRGHCLFMKRFLDLRCLNPILRMVRWVLRRLYFPFVAWIKCERLSYPSPSSSQIWHLPRKSCLRCTQQTYVLHPFSKYTCDDWFWTLVLSNFRTRTSCKLSYTSSYCNELVPNWSPFHPNVLPHSSWWKLRTWQST